MRLFRITILLCIAGLLAGCGAATPAAQGTPGASTTSAPPPASTPAAVATSAATNIPTQAATEPAATPAVAATGVVTPTVSPELLTRAQTLIQQFLNGDDAAFMASFDPTMKTAFPADKVAQTRVQLLAQLGAFKRFVSTHGAKADQYDVVLVTTEFENATVDFRMVFDQSGQLAGFFVQPSQAATPTPYTAPAYANSSAFHEQEVTVGSGEWALPGTLTLPNGSGPFPAVVLVHGSGPNDRDETIGPNKPFRDLAWGLASRGVAVLRYEKRTRQYASKFTPEVLATLTVKEEVTDDALAAVALLRQTPGIDAERLYVLGHSLGGYVLPRIGAADPQIAGLIFMAAPTRPLEDITLEQVKYLSGLDGTVTPDEQAAIDKLTAAVARVKDPNLSPSTPASELPLGIPASYWLDLRGYNPADAAKGLKERMLILQGGRDYQVTPDNLDGWKAALGSRPDVEIKLYPDLNHLMIAGQGKSTPEEYQVEGHVAEQVVVDIADWISK